MENRLEVKATTVEGASEMYAVGRSTVRRAIRRKELKVSRVGRRIVIRIADIERWLGKSR
jgi:excisionase family DNA binding protein